MWTGLRTWRTNSPFRSCSPATPTPSTTSTRPAWVACFTADGIFQVGTRAMQGAAALRGYADVHVREIRCRHMMSNFLYEVRGNEAAGQCSMLATLATAGGYRIFAQGRYLDRLVRQDGVWRIAHRKVETDQLASDPTGITSIADPEVAVLVRPLVDAARKLGRRVAASE